MSVKTIEIKAIGLKELNDELLKTTKLMDEATDPKGMKELSAKAGELTNKISDINDEIGQLKAANFDQVKGKVIKLGDDISKVGAGIAGAFAAANGAVGVFGDSLGYSEEEMKKAQETAASYLSIVASIKPLFEGGVAAIELGMAAYKSLSTGLKAAQTAQIGLNVAMTANPIGLVVVAVVALIAAIAAIGYAIYSFREEIYDVIQSISEMGTGMKILIGILGGPFTIAILGTIELLKYFGVIESQAAEDSKKAMNEKVVAAKKETEARISEIRKQRKALEEQIVKEKEAVDEKVKGIDYEIKKRQAAGEDTKKLEKEKLQLLVNSAMVELRNRRTILEMLDAELFARRDYMIASKKLQGENTEGLEAELNKEKAARKRIRDEELGEFEDNLELQLQNLELFNIAAAKAAKDAAKVIKEVSKSTKNAIEKVTIEIENITRKSNDKLATGGLEIYKKQENLRISLMEEGSKKDKMIRENEFMNKLAELEKEGILTAELRKKLYDDFEKKEKDAQLQEELERIDAVTQKRAEGLNAITSLTEGVFALTNRFGKQDEENAEKRAKRQFKISKALMLAMAINDGIGAAQKSLVMSPLTTLGIPNPGAISALAFTVATSLGNIAKIAASKYEGGGQLPETPSAPPSTSSSISSPASQQQPNFNLFGGGNNMNTKTSQQEINGSNMNNNMMIEAVISESSINDNMRSQNMRRQISEL